MYVRVGKKVYSEYEIENLSVEEISKIQQHVREQQLFTSNKIDEAKLLMGEDNPISDIDYFSYKKKLRILNSVATYLAGIKKKRNAVVNKTENERLIQILRSVVTEEQFQEACAMVHGRSPE